MILSHACIIAASLLPVLTVGSAKFLPVRAAERRGRFDNENPREWEGRQIGWRQRAVAAQQNGFEGLPLFIAAVVLAEMAHAEPSRIDALALAYVLTRLVFVVVYVAGWGAVRSLVWTVGLFLCFALLALAG